MLLFSLAPTYIDTMTPLQSTELELAPCTIGDVPALTDVWYAAFTDAFIRTIWPDTPDVRQWWDESNRSDMLQRPYQHFLKIVDPSSVDENGRPRIAAFVKWDTAMPQERGPRFPAWAKDMSDEKCNAFLEMLEANRLKVMGDKKHYCKTWEPSHIALYPLSSLCLVGQDTESI